MSAPLEAFARSGWLDDPVALAAGRAVTALVIALAARAAELGRPGELTAAEWAYHLDPCDADRAERAGLVTIERLPRGVVLVHLSAWVLVQVDTDRAIVRRLQTRERVRRHRARQRDADDQLDLFEGETDDGPINGLACGSACGRTADVTLPVTLPVTQRDAETPRSIYPRARRAPAVRTSQEQEERITRSVVARNEKQWTTTGEGSGLRLLMAIVEKASDATTLRRRLSRDERRALLDRVRTTCKQANFTVPPERMIRKAIELNRRYGRRLA